MNRQIFLPLFILISLISVIRDIKLKYFIYIYIYYLLNKNVIIK